MSSRKRQLKYYGASDAIVWPEDHPKVSKPAGRKDTKRWCRGKVGVQHVPTITRETGYGSLRPCRVPDEWALRLWPKRLWSCRHRETCETCGKVLRVDIQTSECPEFAGVQEANHAD